MLSAPAHVVNVKEICPGGNKEVKLPRGITKVNASNGCEILGKDFKLPTPSTAGSSQLEVEVANFSVPAFPEIPEIHREWTNLDIPHLKIFPMEDLHFLSSHVELVKSHSSTTYWVLALALVMVVLLCLYIARTIYRWKNVICLKSLEKQEHEHKVVRFNKEREKVVLDGEGVSRKKGENNSSSVNVEGGKMNRSTWFSTLGTQVFTPRLGKSAPAVPQSPPPKCTRPPTPVPLGHQRDKEVKKSQSLVYEDMSKW